MSDADNTLLLAAHTISCQLRIYRIQVQWNLPANSNSVPEAQRAAVPRMQVQHIKLEQRFAPLHSAKDEDGSATSSSPLDPSQAHLSHLEFVPVAPESKQRGPTYPAVVAVFSCMPGSNSNGQQSQELFSIISRWELRSTNQTLHRSFTQLASKRANGNLNLESSVSLRTSIGMTPAQFLGQANPWSCPAG